MEALLRSFVHKVRALHDDFDHIHHLLPILQPHTAPDLLETTLEMLLVAVRRSHEEWEDADGPRHLVLFVLRYARTRTPSPSIRKLVTKLLLVVPSELPDVCRTAKAAPAVLGWLLDGDDDLSLFQLVLRFSWEDDLVKEAIEPIFHTLFGRPTVLTPLASRALAQCVRDERSGDTFWTLGGGALLEHSFHSDGGGPAALQHLARHAPDATGRALAILDMEHLGPSLVRALEDTTHPLMDWMPVFTLFSAPLAMASTLCNPLCRRLVDEPAHNDLLYGCEVLLTFAQCCSPSRDLLRQLEDRFEGTRCCVMPRLLCACAPLTTLTWRFAEFLTLARDDEELDSALVKVFGRLCDDPAALVHPLRLQGPWPCDPMLHLVDVLLPCRGVLDDSPTYVAHLIRKHLVTKGQEEMRAHPTLGLARHLGGSAVPPPSFQTCFCTCPITLEHVHCPVVVSDGHTYELSALVRMARTAETTEALRSPLTRQSLSTWVTHNRCVLDLERNLFHLVPVRRRRRHIIHKEA